MAPNVAGSIPVSHPNSIFFHFWFIPVANPTFLHVAICPTFSEMLPQPVKQQSIFLVQKRVNPIWLKVQMLPEQTALEVLLRIKAAAFPFYVRSTSLLLWALHGRINCSPSCLYEGSELG